MLVDIVWRIEDADKYPLWRYQNSDSAALSSLEVCKLDEFRYGVIPEFQTLVREHAILKSVDSVREQELVDEQYPFLLRNDVF